jgi:hypothetical protein
MYAIAAIKRKVETMRDEGKELIWQNLFMDEAVKEACVHLAPLLKQNVLLPFQCS